MKSLIALVIYQILTGYLVLQGMDAVVGYILLPEGDLSSRFLVATLLTLAWSLGSLLTLVMLVRSASKRFNRLSYLYGERMAELGQLRSQIGQWEMRLARTEQRHGQKMIEFAGVMAKHAQEVHVYGYGRGWQGAVYTWLSVNTFLAVLNVLLRWLSRRTIPAFVGSAFVVILWAIQSARVDDELGKFKR